MPDNNQPPTAPPVLENVKPNQRVNINVAASNGMVSMRFGLPVEQLNINPLEAMQLASIVLQKAILAAKGESDSRIVTPFSH